MSVRALYLSAVSTLGGAELSLIDLISALDASRHTALVAVPNHGPLSDALRDLGVEVCEVPALARLSRPRSALATAHALLELGRARRQLAELCRSFRPDRIHANGLSAALPASLLPDSRASLIWHVRDLAMPEPVVRLVSRRCRHVIVPSAACRNRVVGRLSSHRIHLVPNGIDVDRFRSARAPATEGSLRLLSVGQLVPWKGHALALEALALASARIPHLRLSILATNALDGSHDPALQDLKRDIVRLRLTARVSVLPHVRDPERYLSASSLLLHVAYPEPFGRVVIEAFAAGLPVLALDGAHGPAELVRQSGAGLLVAHPSPEAVAAALCLLAEHPHWRQQLAAAGPPSARRLWDRRQMADRVASIYAL